MYLLVSVSLRCRTSCVAMQLGHFSLAFPGSARQGTTSLRDSGPGPKPFAFADGWLRPLVARSATVFSGIPMRMRNKQRGDTTSRAGRPLPSVPSHDGAKLSGPGVSRDSDHAYIHLVARQKMAPTQSSVRCLCQCGHFRRGMAASSTGGARL